MNHVVESYENYREEDRLTTNNARKIEFITTVKTFETNFPKSGKILDCAAGTGVYSFYFAERGYDVTALDITPRHIENINQTLQDKSFKMQTAVNDATDLSRFDNDTYDIVLCMGPIYHLTNEVLRLKCLNECKRVLKSEGLLAVAYINRFYVFPYVSTSDKKYFSADLAKTLVETGTIKYDDPNCFWTDSYYAIPEEMEHIFSNMNLKIIDHLATDGLSPFLRDKVDKMNESEFGIWCDYHYMVCRESSILGASNHGLIIGRK